MASAEDHLQPLFKKLKDLGRDGEYESALKVSEEILKSLPDDADALHCKAVCLVQCDRFPQAMKLLDRLVKVRPDGANTFTTTKAYCMYRMGKYKECLDALDGMPGADSIQGALELKAQALYRLEEYRKSSETYEKLTRVAKDDLEEERQTNVLASKALRALKDDEFQDTTFESNLATYEQNFNASLAAAARGRQERASQLLARAEQLCREVCEEEGYEDEEIEEELNILRIQKAYLLQLAGDATAANELYQACVKCNPDDITQVAIASNNILVLNGERDIFDSKKRVRVLSSEASLAKLSSRQRQTIFFNQILYSLLLGQTAAAKEWLAKVQTEEKRGGGSAGGDLSVLGEVSLLVRQNQSSQALERLRAAVAARRPGNDDDDAGLPLRLTLAALQQSGRSGGGAASEQTVRTLLACPGLLDHLGLVTYLVHCYSRQGDSEAAHQLWIRTVAHHEERVKRAGGQEEVATVLRRVLLLASGHMLDSGRHRPAVECLERLRGLDPANHTVLLRLVSAYSRFDPARAEQLISGLPTPRQVAALDVDILEGMPMYRYVHRTTKPPSATTTTTTPSAPGKSSTAATTTTTTEKKKKKRKPRLPKNFNPNGSADPERWLPLSERSYFKRGKKKAAAQALRGTQGAAGGLSAALTDKLDASKPTPTATSGGDNPAAGEKSGDVKSPKPKSQPKSLPKKKGKKKGKGW